MLTLYFFSTQILQALTLSNLFPCDLLYVINCAIVLKRQALESSLDQVQRELVETKAEKNDLIRSEAALRSQLEDFQVNVLYLVSIRSKLISIDWHF